MNMSGFMRIAGAVAMVFGLVMLILPFAASDWIANGAAVTTAAVLLVTGPALIGLGQLITIAENIQNNTNWLSAGSSTGREAGNAQSDTPPAEEPQQPEPEAELPPKPKPEQQRQPPPPPPSPQEPAPATPPPAAPPQSAPPQSAPTQQLYDASKHPAAVEEWTHHGRRVMTLEDGTFATEVDGAWYRFINLQDIEALDR